MMLIRWLMVAALVPLAARAESGEKPEILILGTYHMGNPGQDIFNLKADDVLAPRRQQELAQVLEVLKRFKPTRIAIEVDVTSKKSRKEYAAYLEGKYTLTRNEIDQLGFRLAKELGHAQIYPVDVDGEFPMQRVINYAKANGKGAQLEALMSSWGAEVKAMDAFLASHTILEMLERMNSEERVAKDVAGYFEIVPYGEPYEYAGPDLLAAWYQRNIRIYRNIRALADSPKERILVIYGAGHLGWLQQNALNDAAVKLRKLSELTEKKS